MLRHSSISSFRELPLLWRLIAFSHQLSAFDDLKPDFEKEEYKKLI